MTRLRIGILETGAPPGELKDRFPSYPAMFEALLAAEPFDFTSFNVRDDGPPASVEACQGYIVTGSSSGAYDADPWIGDLRAFLAAAKGRAALVGVCFGHQLMVEAFGGKVIKSPKGWGRGLHHYAMRMAEPWIDPGPLIAAPASHQDQVVEPPPAARILAGSDFTPNGMLAYDDQPAISIQLHPEFEPAYAKALIELRRGRIYTDEEADNAVASLDAPNDRARLGTWIGNFLRARAAG